MDRASLTFSRKAAGHRTDDFEDTVPNASMLPLQDRGLIGDTGQEFPGHWGLPPSFAPQAVDEPPEATDHGFPDTVPYGDLDDELTVGVVGDASAQSNRQGRASEALFAQRAPANLKRQALAPEHSSAADVGGFPDTVWQPPPDFLSKCMPSGELGAGTRGGPNGVAADDQGVVSSKGGSVRPAHWGLSTDLDEYATEVALPNLRMVGIGDLRQVSSHMTCRVAGATRHIVRFRNGGFVRFAYGIDDSVVELSGERISVRIGVQGDVLITAHSAQTVKGGA